ncbi:glycosyltransferase [Desulfonatronospira sp.]|uniref:glycosyltransferase n=1 Tax=Desulfonatronospira sp. TaxID=1962951 RepID=UPI0025BF7E28|nr:glycosyltransferase [Desulfonatronospira sp.]
MKKVSVIVRTKDRPQLLHEALQSLALQEQDGMEVVVINDGGCEVKEVISSFYTELDIVYQYLVPGKGRSQAANAGIKMAQGQWILFLDDDDLYLPQGISALMAEALDEHTVIYGQVTANLYQNQDNRSHPQLIRRFGRPFNIYLLYFENFIPMIGCLFPARLLELVQGFDPGIECFEDWDLMLRLSKVARFRFVDVPVAEYRVFEHGFIIDQGAGNLQRQVRASIYSKHWSLFNPDALSFMHYYLKTDFIPQELAFEANRFLNRIQQLEQEKQGADAYARQLEQEKQGADAYARQLEQANFHLEDALRSLREDTLLSFSQVLVSIIIVNYNGIEHLKTCLPALMRTQKVPFEVLVVDNASSDGSVQWLQETYPEVKTISMETNLGFGRGNHLGVENARGQLVVFLNSDTMVEPDWLWTLIQPLYAEPDIGAVCSTLRLLEHPQVVNARGGGMTRLGFGFDHDFGFVFEQSAAPDKKSYREVLFPSGAAMAMRKDDFEAFGFDPAFFMYHEDVDLGWRIWLAGKRVVACDNSLVYHKFGGTSGITQNSRWREIMGSRHNLRSLWKNYQWQNAAKVTFRLLQLWHQERAYRTMAGALFWNARHVWGTWKERRKVQQVRKIQDMELVQKGLITQTRRPPVYPDTSHCSSRIKPLDLIPNCSLLPGQYSALGRLGPGWYEREFVGNAMARMTSGRASCTLRVEPCAAGTVQIWLHVPKQISAKEVRIACNDSQEVFYPTGALWDCVEVPACADEHGLIQIYLSSSVWTPAEYYHNNDLRKMGCAVRELRFAPQSGVKPKKPMGASVIITTYNRWSILKRTLQALGVQTCKDFEVIVVDDGSEDGTWDELAAWQKAHPDLLQMKVVRQENSGQGPARNHALQYTQKEIVIFLGDDIIPEQDFVEQHLARHEAFTEPVAFVGFTDWAREQIWVTPSMEHVNKEGQQFGYRHMQDGQDVPYTCFYTSNLSIPRHVLGDNPFDPIFNTYGWEDVELGYRLSLRGLRIIYAAEARASHLHPMSLLQIYARQIKIGQGIHKLYALHPLMAADNVMPRVRSGTWINVAHFCMQPLLYALNTADKLRLRIPGRILDKMLGIAFLKGLRGSSTSY